MKKQESPKEMPAQKATTPEALKLRNAVKEVYDAAMRSVKATNAKFLKDFEANPCYALEWSAERVQLAQHNMHYAAGIGCRVNALPQDATAGTVRDTISEYIKECVSNLVRFPAQWSNTNVIANLDEMNKRHAHSDCIRSLANIIDDYRYM